MDPKIKIKKHVAHSIPDGRPRKKRKMRSGSYLRGLPVEIKEETNGVAPVAMVQQDKLDTCLPQILKNKK